MLKIINKQIKIENKNFSFYGQDKQNLFCQYFINSKFELASFDTQTIFARPLDKKDFFIVSNFEDFKGLRLEKLEKQAEKYILDNLDI